tara:strand:+ start:2643 stop:2918 length:276 start_codon:yes stop_codon:yes gene_type:complete
MSEKTGNTEKLKNDFIDSKLLEVYLPRLDNWYRVTCRDFRSFDGKRRVQGENYEGPLYAYGTNRLVKFNNTSTIMGSEVLNERNKRSQKLR